MDWGKLTQNAEKLFHKYKYVLLIIVVGIVLMLIPDFKKESLVSATEPAAPQQENAEEKLQKILQQVHGAGRVEVMLTVASGEETVFQMDSDISSGQDQFSENRETVIITDSDREQSGLISRKDPPIYLGAIVVCDGADDPEVRLKIVDAVSKATGLGADKISVLKMK